MSYKYDAGGGFSGKSYDRHVFEDNLSTVNKIQREYWTAKQVFKKKFGKEQDQHVVASDQEIDTKLMLFKSIQSTCAELMKEIDNYQQQICNISRDESQLGRFLKDQGGADKTQAGKMMIAVGKSLCFTAQQRINLRNPLGRLHQDVETFRYRAIADCLMSVDQMEEARTHYRASLLWMQDISENLDPEQYKKLEKFRKVQNEVRLNREKFDKQKWAVCQKVDLLSASRSNLFSNTLVPYQEESLKFWDKTSRALAAVLESFKGYQHFEFKLLKSLNPIQDIDLPSREAGKKQEDNDDALISLDEITGAEEAIDALEINDEENKEDNEGPSLIQFDGEKDLLEDNNNPFEALHMQGFMQQQYQGEGDLMGGVADDERRMSNADDMDILDDILGGNDEEQGQSELEKQWQSVFGDFEKQTPPPSVEQSNTELLESVTDGNNTSSSGGYLPSQLMDFSSLGGPQQFNMQQQPGAPLNMMGSTMPQMTGQMPMQNYTQPPIYNALYTQQQQGLPQQGMPQQGIPQTQGPMNLMSAPSKASGMDSSTKATWYNLFAELDPLQNPDEISGKSEAGKNKARQAC